MKSVRALKKQLDAEGIVSKARVDRFGHAWGGVPIAQGALYKMLQNRIYRGEIVHKENVYPGLHEAIIDAELWDEVQTALGENRVERITRSTAAEPSLLAGLVYDDSGEPMSPTHTNKKSRRYRYCVSQSLIKGDRAGASDAACRVPAADLESIVQDRIRALLTDELATLDAAGAASVSARRSLIENASDLARRWPALPASEKRAILQALVERVDLRTSAVDVSVRTTALPDIIKPDLDIRRLPEKPVGLLQVLSVPARLRRTGRETRLLIEGTHRMASAQRTDRSLLRLIAMARQFHDLMTSRVGLSVTELATQAGVSRSYFSRILRLSLLAPDITKAIIQGRQPIGLSAIKLANSGSPACAWSDQRSQFGFD